MTPSEYRKVHFSAVRPQDGSKHDKMSRLLNRICLFVILVITPHMLLTLYYGSMLATLMQLGSMLALCFPIYLNTIKLFNLARISAILIGNIHILNMSLILGLGGGTHYYFSAAIIGPLFFYTFKEWRYIVFFSSVTVVLALLVQFIGTNFEPIAEIPDALLTSFLYFSVFGSILTTLMFVYYFYNESNRYEKSLREVNRRLLELSETDPLTQLPNRRSFNRNLEREWGKGIRNKTSLSAIMIDVDYFKMFNDYYGHQEGDRCLETIAGLISQSTRQFLDYPARYGGEEFIILLSNMNLDSAHTSAERIRVEIMNSAIPHHLSEHGRLLTCSMGVASCVPDNNSAPEDLIRKADKALYKAKDNGRNRTELAL